MMARNVLPGGFEGRAVGNKTPEQLAELSRQFDADVDMMRRALLRQFRNGTDIGELVFHAFTAAQRQVEPGFNLLDNRPGSWESGCLDQMMDQVILGLRYEREEQQ